MVIGGRNLPVTTMATELTPLDAEPDAVELEEKLSAEQFRGWYRERQYRQNIKNGTPFFNENGHVSDPERHSPSQLVQCHRKMFYRQHNAPEEDSDPSGIFWFGTRFEEDIVFPFLERWVTDRNAYVQNSIWVDFAVETEGAELRIKGATDPVIVDKDATPILPTEIKTKSSVTNLSSPSRHHKAQLHAYLAGLSEKFEIELTQGVLIYGGRDSLETKFFHLKFDDQFWEDTVIRWARDHTDYRLDEELPPPVPEYDWECQFCEYRERCGKGATSGEDYGASGFVQEFSGYPIEKVVEYLEGYPDEYLTPTLAQQFPDLTEDYGVLRWYCRSCDSTVDIQGITEAKEPLCPECADRGNISHLELRAESRSIAGSTKFYDGEM